MDDDNCNCIFCKIIEGKIPSAKVYEDRYVYCFLDIHPCNFGHTIVVPKEHYTTLTDVSDENLLGMIKATKRVAKAVTLGLKADGYNILMNNNKAAGQEVMHAHIHVMPRFNNDGIKLAYDSKKYNDKEIELYKEKIAKNI